MANWCMTSFAVECEDKQKLQRICDAIAKCNKGELENYEGCKSWTGNIFKVLGLEYESDRCFWHEAYIEGGVLYISEESAWCRGTSMRQLIGQLNNPEEPDNDLIVYFQSEEPGCEIYETNDGEGGYFSSRYVFDEYQDGEEYYSTFEGLCNDVNNFLNEKNDFKDFDAVKERLDKYNEESEDYDRWAYVHEFDTEASL